MTIKVKDTMNINLDSDIAEFFRDNFRGNASRIINNLSREFKREVEKDQQAITDVMYGNFSICLTSKGQCKPQD
jgi:hypothetical protein